MSQRHSNHSLKIHGTAESSAITVGLLTSLSHNLNSDVTAPDTGDPFDVAQVVTMQKPELGFATHSLKSIMDLIGLGGKCVVDDGSHPGVVAYAQRHDECGTFGRASSNHLSMTYAKCFLTIEQIAASVGRDAILTGRVRGRTTSASTAPYAVAFNASLPASPTVDERYTLGKAVVLGTAVDRILSQTVDYNAQITVSNDADSIWPSIVDVEKIRTLITIVTEDPAWLNDTGRISHLGEPCAHANTKIHWIRREVTGTPVSGGTFKDFAGSHHIMGTCAGLVHVSEHYSASGSGVSSTQIQILGIESGGVAPIVWDTTNAYTTSF